MSRLEHLIRKNEEPVKAVGIENGLTGAVTMSLSEIGGPIVSGKNLEDAKKEFEKALELAVAVRNLLYFNELSKFDTIEDQRAFIDNNPEFEVNEVAYC